MHAHLHNDLTEILLGSSSSHSVSHEFYHYFYNLRPPKAPTPHHIHSIRLSVPAHLLIWTSFIYGAHFVRHTHTLQEFSNRMMYTRIDVIENLFSLKQYNREKTNTEIFIYFHINHTWVWCHIESNNILDTFTSMFTKTDDWPGINLCNINKQEANNRKWVNENALKSPHLYTLVSLEFLVSVCLCVCVCLFVCIDQNVSIWQNRLDFLMTTTIQMWSNNCWKGQQNNDVLS